MKLWLIPAMVFTIGVSLMTPILWAALGELVSEQSGVLNVGIEGVEQTGCDGRQSDTARDLFHLLPVILHHRPVIPCELFGGREVRADTVVANDGKLNVPVGASSFAPTRAIA